MIPRGLVSNRIAYVRDHYIYLMKLMLLLKIENNFGKRYKHIGSGGCMLCAIKFCKCDQM